MSEPTWRQLDNGLTVALEPIAGAESLAMSWFLPAGVIHEPAQALGVGSLLTEMIFRGAGELDARGHSDALDDLGVDRDASVESTHLRLSATMLGDRMGDALPLLLDMGLRPRLEAASLDPSRELALQAIEAMEDEPQQQVFVDLRKRHLPQPYGRSLLGEIDTLEAITPDQVRGFVNAHFVPGGAILALAGKLDVEAAVDRIASLTGDWSGAAPEPPMGAPAPGGYTHVDTESTQMHVGMAYAAAPESSPESVRYRAAAAALSGGMSGRLMAEIREKRGLCYSVYAAYAGNKHLGVMMSYAGSTADRVQETADVLAAELRRLAQGVSPSEFDRVKVGMKSRLVMQGESSGARAANIASDCYIYGRPRSLDEVAAEVEALTLDGFNAFLADHPPGPLTIVSVGPRPLRPPTDA